MYPCRWLDSRMSDHCKWWCHLSILQIPPNWRCNLKVRIVNNQERNPIHFYECLHFRTDLFDSKCQAELLILIAMKFANLPGKFTQWIYSANLLSTFASKVCWSVYKRFKVYLRSFILIHCHCLPNPFLKENNNLARGQTFFWNLINNTRLMGKIIITTTTIIIRSIYLANFDSRWPSISWIELYTSFPVIHKVGSVVVFVLLT